MTLSFILTDVTVPKTEMGTIEEGGIKLYEENAPSPKEIE